MRGQADDLRSALEQERQARQRAEALLEAKSQELSEANRNLILEAEVVRSALAETEALRSREATILRERTILTAALTALTGHDSADAAMQALLGVLQTTFDIFDACFVQADPKGLRIAASAVPDHAGLILPLSAELLSRPRRMAGLTPPDATETTPASAAAPQALMGEVRAVLIAPLAPGSDLSGGLLLSCLTEGRFSVSDLRTLERVARLAAQTLLSLREARRNALLVSLIEGRPVSAVASVLDAPLEAVHRAFGRMTDMQGKVVGVLDALLTTPIARVDTGIDQTLVRMGEMTQMDRVYVFRISADGTKIDNTHEWCAPGIAPMREMLQGLPIELIAHWRARFDSDADVVIPDVAALPADSSEKSILDEQGIRSLLAVPLTIDGRLAGFVGYDAVRTRRSFLPGEVHLIRSVAKVIAALMARRDAEAELTTAHAETLAQRARLEAVLSAMPDLVVELDSEGRFVTWHSGAVVVPEALATTFQGRLLEEVLPADLARKGREILARLDAGDTVSGGEIRFALTGPLRDWQLTASRIAGQGYLLVMRDVTAARAQSAEVERLSKIARRTTNLVVVTDAKRRVEWVNQAFTATTGWTLDAIRGRNPGCVLQCEETDPATVARIRTALDAGLPVQAEVLNRARNGRLYWSAMDIQPLKDSGGVLQGFMAVQTDVTERRRQAEALRQAAEDAARARANLEAAVEALQDGFVLYDAEDRLVLCNCKYREIYPQSAPAIVRGATFESILRYGLKVGEYADAIGREEDWLAERLTRHRAVSAELEQQLADGRWMRIYERATPDGGRVGLWVDITALKQAEQRALADRSAAMEASHDGIAMTDAEGRYIYMNRAHLEMFGLEDDSEVIGRPWTMLFDRAMADWFEDNALTCLQSEGSWSGELTGLAPDGRTVDIEVSLTLKDDGGVLSIARDMRRRRTEAAERERLREELHLAQRREVVGQMAAGLAHDFNNFLAAISGSASLIAANAAPGSAEAAGAGRIEAASEQAAALVRRLLSLGARPSERRRLDMRGPLTEAASLLRAAIKAPVWLDLSLPEMPVEVTADPSDILQVVLNLCVNARDALEGAAGTITLALSDAEATDLAGPFVIGGVEAGRRYVALRVEDTGPGIPPELQHEIFAPYVTTKGDKGTGLGLSIVGSVVAANDGAVRMRSAPGQGASFTILWPVELSQSPAPVAQAGPLSGRLDGRRILLVDDQPEVLEVLTAFLEAAGAEVAPSTEPEDIVSAVIADPDAWDLVVTDYDMPGMTGDALAEAVREGAPGLPVILVTALAGLSGRRGAGFVAVLGKPVDRNALVHAAESAILGGLNKGSD